MKKIQIIVLVLMLTGFLLPVTTSGGDGSVTVTAKSGSANDIQSAVNEIVASGGIGDVYIPAGTFNFVEVGETWTGTKVIIPAGINLFGAPTERTSGLPYDGVGQNPNDQVVEWKTIIQIPCEANPSPPTSSVTMFLFEGHGNPNKPSRVSNIKFVGYREIDHTSTYWYSTIQMWNVIDFRIDHCFFKHLPHQSVNVRAPANADCCGVIDHCNFVNDYGFVEWDWALCTVGYGVSMRKVGSTLWEDDITKVVGQYTPYTVFIEDSYFSRWRHCTCSNDGYHYVFRHNTIEKDSVVGSIDGHGVYDYVSTRAMEIYNNILVDPIQNKYSGGLRPDAWQSMEPVNGEDGYAVNWRGGGGVFFNNLVRNYEVGVSMVDEDHSVNHDVEKCRIHDLYMWDNTFTNVRIPTQTYSDYRTIQQNIDYFFSKPTWYTSYTYPHPLTIGDNPPNGNGNGDNDYIIPTTLIGVSLILIGGLLIWKSRKKRS